MDRQDVAVGLATSWRRSVEIDDRPHRPSAASERPWDGGGARLVDLLPGARQSMPRGYLEQTGVVESRLAIGSRGDSRPPTRQGENSSTSPAHV
ncbi:MAG: hypothetical protein ACRYG2_09885 [Janthinobacterium lividum]